MLTEGMQKKTRPVVISKWEVADLGDFWEEEEKMRYSWAGSNLHRISQFFFSIAEVT